MDKIKILDLIKVGENIEVEFKASKNELPKSVWSTYSAFANTEGGVIVLGIEEDKEKHLYSICGVNNVEDIIKDFWTSINNKEKVSANIIEEKGLNVIKVDDKTLITIEVPEVDRKLRPIYINNNIFNGSYKRQYEGDFKCREDEIRKMIIDAYKDIYFDSIIMDECCIDNIDSDTLKDYRKRFELHMGKEHQWNKLSDKDFLCAINALDRESNNLTRAGALMFGNKETIMKQFPSVFLDYWEIEDSSKTERWSDRICPYNERTTGSLWDFFSKIEIKMTRDLPIPFALDEKMMRIDVTDAHKSVREALANCLVHTNFAQPGNTLVIKADNYFRFDNPGDMRVKGEKAFLNGTSEARNPTLHTMFSYLGYGERAGSGLSLIKTTWEEKGWPSPSFEVTKNPDKTSLMLYIKKEGEMNLNYNFEGLNETQIKILEILRDNPYTSSQKISELIDNVSFENIRWQIRKLKDLGFIAREGTNKNGKWTILK